MIRRTCSTTVALLALLPSLVAGCSNGDEGDSGSRLEAGSGGSPGGGGTPPADLGGGDGAVSTPCTSSEDCAAELECHPIARTCVATGDACTEHGDCALGQYCEAGSGHCLPGLAGSPCASGDNCADGGVCAGGHCGCSEFSQVQDEEAGPLDLFFIFDRTASMNEDCPYEYGSAPPIDSKACYATYAMSDYLIDVAPVSDTRLAFDFMSYDDQCDGAEYLDPLVGLTSLPVAVGDELVTVIDAEDFSGGSGTRIESALRGLASFTAANRTDGREMIGVLMTDGDPTDDCESDIGALATIIADHLAATGIRTFIIGMEGATESSLEELAVAGGAEPHDDYCGALTPPCHDWNVGTGSGAAVADALQAISAQAVPLPCEYPLSGIAPPDGQVLDLATLNVRLTDAAGASTFMPQVASPTACPAAQPAWHFDDPATPTEVVLCPNACELVTVAAAGAEVSIVGGCTQTVTLR